MKLKRLFMTLLMSLLLTSCGNDSSSSFTSSGEQSLKDKYGCITIQEALDIASNLTAETTERYYIYGVINSITDYTYGAMMISDETASISVYNVYSNDGKIRYDSLTDKPQVNDEIVLHATLSNYKGTLEIHSGHLVEFKKGKANYDINDYKDMSIASSRDVVKGSKVIVEGIVIRITYAFGKKPNGFYLVDNSSSIYVYDSNLANLLKEGNTIKIAAEKDYWILESEVENAAKYGYVGANQLINAHLINNDKKTDTAIDFSWVKETTIKKILNTSFSEDITNLIYKVNSYVKKSVQQGYTNYYFNDIDGITGTYTYTQCNGSDFSWVDQYDGKICTVYIAMINAKSTASGCLYRAMPIKISDDNYKFDTKNVGEYIYEYHVKDLFKETYNSDPTLEVPTICSSILLGFDNAFISYASSDEEIANFVTTSGKTYFHINNKEGSVVITLTIKYGSNEDYVKFFNVTYTKMDIPTSISIKEALQKENGTTVTIRGIAGPGLINKIGFYLIDDSGIIPVLVSGETMSNIGYGNEVIISGTKELFGQSGKTAYQVAINDGTLVLNLGGMNDYSNSSFISDKSIADLYKTSVEEANYSQGYIVTGQIKKVVSSYSVNYSVSDENGTYISIYSAGKAITYFDNFTNDNIYQIELALCNWNSKNYVRCSVLAIIVDGVRQPNLNNYK